MSAKEYFAGRRRAAPKARQGTRTVLYLRVSTADQKPDLQYDGLRSYAARAGLDVVQDYCDVAVSMCRRSLCGNREISRPIRPACRSGPHREGEEP